MGTRSPLARVRGLGAAKEGVSHWWTQRLSAIALVPLSLWFIFSLAAMTGADHGTVRAWASQPLVASLLVLLVAATFHHGYLGLQVVIEDYVHHEGLKFTSLLLIKGAAILLAVIGIFSVLRLLFGG